MYSSSSPVESLRSDIATLSSQVTRLTQELEQTRHDVNYLIESSIDTPNIYLKPNDLAKLVGCSHSTIKRYRNDGTIKESSIKRVKREKRTDYYYHRFAAIKDIQAIRPLQIKTKK
mgnify:CR=1 FL=1